MSGGIYCAVIMTCSTNILAATGAVAELAAAFASECDVKLAIRYRALKLDFQSTVQALLFAIVASVRLSNDSPRHSLFVRPKMKQYSCNNSMIGANVYRQTTGTGKIQI